MQRSPYRLLSTLLLGVFFFILPPLTHAALTSTQIDSVVSLLTAFNVDATTISVVRQQLTGTPGGCSFQRNLKIGSTGSDVLMLQKDLIARGYTNVRATGTYGAATQSAVAAWQRSHNVLPDNGAFGTTTRAAYVCRAIKVPQPVAPATTPVASTTPVIPTTPAPVTPVVTPAQPVTTPNVNPSTDDPAAIPTNDPDLPPPTIPPADAGATGELGFFPVRIISALANVLSAFSSTPK